MTVVLIKVTTPLVFANPLLSRVAENGGFCSYAATLSGQPFQVVPLGENLRLEPAHGIGACCLSLGVSPSNDDSHGRVLGQPFNIVGVLVASNATVHRLPE